MPDELILLASLGTLLKPREKKFRISLIVFSIKGFRALTFSFRRSNSSLGFSFTKVGVGTSFLFSSIKRTFTKPANPDTHSV